MAATAAETGRVLIEAFHYRYHPLAARMKEIVDGGELGANYGSAAPFIPSSHARVALGMISVRGPIPLPPSPIQRAAHP